MSILIRDMGMPEDCDSCAFFDDRYDYPTCSVTHKAKGYNWNPRGQRMPDCPITEVVEENDIYHVGSTPEIMGYEK